MARLLSRLGLATVALCALTAAGASSLEAQRFDRTQARTLIGTRLKIVKIPDLFVVVDPAITSAQNLIKAANDLITCKNELRPLSTAANTCLTTCNSEGGAPPGSPLANFNAASNTQLAQICGTLTLQACVDKVIADQQAFCRDTTCKAQRAAQRAKAIECAKANIRIKTLCTSLTT